MEENQTAEAGTLSNVASIYLSTMYRMSIEIQRETEIAYSRRIISTERLETNAASVFAAAIVHGGSSRRRRRRRVDDRRRTFGRQNQITRHFDYCNNVSPNIPFIYTYIHIYKRLYIDIEREDESVPEKCRERKLCVERQSKE